MSYGQKTELLFQEGKGYAAYRPQYPLSLLEYLSAVTKDHKLAWDCGTGSGQAAQHVAKHFDRVIATDISHQQLEHAVICSNVEYRLCPAESSGLDDASVDLITVAQAFHWFKRQLFFDEVNRVLKPGGVLAVWTYSLFIIDPAIDAVVLHLYKDILGDTYWAPERKEIETGYRNICFPPEWTELSTPTFDMQCSWDFMHCVNYLKTWSAVHTYTKAKSACPVELILDELASAWGSKDMVRSVHFPLSMRVLRKD